MRFRDGVRIVLGSGTGKVGMSLLAILVGISVAVPFLFPLDFGLKSWNNPLVWADNPKAVPPAWTALLDGTKQPKHHAVELEDPTSVFEQDQFATRTYSFPFTFRADAPPSFLSLTLGEITFNGRPPTVTLTITRPDGATVRLVQQVIRGIRPDETPPVTRFAEAPQRTFLSGDSGAFQAAADFARKQFGLPITESEIRGRLEAVIFGVPDPLNPVIEGFQVLRGDYTATVRITTSDPRDTVESVKFVAGGGVYGLMGTDSQGRNLATGLLFGFPVALLIGVLTSIGATAIGTFFGIVSGFMGGKTDMAIQRMSDILTNIPLLPILIFLIFILGQKLWLVMAILVLFGWPGLTIILRSMVLQVRSGQLVEATRALGASRRRIMFRHIFFQMAPFIVAQMIFFTPAAILAEAGLSFLGLGDPSLPTWGQILEAGFRTGAIYVGYWWWILPPGILIVITAMAFVLLALALEPVLNPRLRGRAT
jgi:peptide/nickel transport system permease protein